MLIKWLSFATREQQSIPLNYQRGVNRLRLLTGSITLMIIVMMILLTRFSYQLARESQLESYRQEARNLVQVTNTKLFRKLVAHSSIPIQAFDYYSNTYNPQTRQSDTVRSPLASLLTQPDIPGLIGFFQINENRQFSTPYWPQSMLLATKQSQASVVTKADPLTLTLQRLVAQSSTITQVINKKAELEKQQWRIAFDLPDHLLFYRLTDDAKQTRLQGFITHKQAYLQSHINDILALRSFASSVQVTLKDKSVPRDSYFLYQKTKTNEINISNPKQQNSELQQQRLYSSKLKWPYSNFDILIYTKTQPFSTNMIIGGALYMAIFVGLLIGCVAFYKLGFSQLQLAEQRLNFVSAISHELKTPLTSIKMYSEMLQSGIVQTPVQQAEYYDFIHSESERLARLIENILQLAKLNHHTQIVKPQHVSVAVLMDLIHSKTASLMLKHGFKHNVTTHLSAPEKTLLSFDLDAFSQVIINVTDNAIKFFNQAKINDAERQKIDFTFRLVAAHSNRVELEIRDYGAGIAESQEKKIFELFYRAGNELTRATQGTGIGLALVEELIHAHHGSVTATRKTPGLAINVTFPIHSTL